MVYLGSRGKKHFQKLLGNPTEIINKPTEVNFKGSLDIKL